MSSQRFTEIYKSLNVFKLCYTFLFNDCALTNKYTQLLNEDSYLPWNILNVKSPLSMTVEHSYSKYNATI